MTAIPPDFDLKIAPLFGCAVTTAAGVINNDAQGEDRRVGGGVRRRRRRAQRGPVRAACRRLSDRRGRPGRQQARDGEGARRDALHQRRRRSATWTPTIREIVGAKGPDKVIETTGAKSVIELAYDLTHADGTCVLVGVPNEKVSIYTLPIHFNKVLTGSHGGDARAAHRHSAHHPAGRRPDGSRSTASSPTNSRWTRSTRRSTWCAAAMPAGC